MKSNKRRLPTYHESGVLRRIAQTGCLMLTHTDDGDRYSDGAGVTIDVRDARALIRNGWVIADRDSMFDLTPQSWRARNAAP